jgi:hypothetical protein
MFELLVGLKNVFVMLLSWGDVFRCCAGAVSPLLAACFFAADLVVQPKNGRVFPAKTCLSGKKKNCTENSKPKERNQHFQQGARPKFM